MAPQRAGSGSAMPPSEWPSSAHPYARHQQVAFLRAAAIALVLLGVLAVIVLF